MPRKRKRVGAFKDDFLSVYILGNCRILYIQRAHPACFFKALRRTPRNDGNACRALYLHWRKRKRKHGGGYNFIRFGYRRSIRRKLFNNEKPHKEKQAVRIDFDYMHGDNLPAFYHFHLYAATHSPF